MSFTILSWNIEHFKGGGNRAQKVADHIKALNPDIFGLLETKEAGTRPDGTPYFVRVDGWLQLEGNERKKFIEEILDHCSLWVGVENK